MKKKPLEERCTFFDECALSVYDFEICTEDYVNCKIYQRIIKSKLEEYQKNNKQK